MIRHTRIPTNGCIEALRTTSRVVAHRNIVQFSVPHPVQPRVQKPERTPTGTDPCIVEHGNNGGEGGSGAGRALAAAPSAFVDVRKVHGLRGDVGDTLCGSKYLVFRHLGRSGTYTALAKASFVIFDLAKKGGNLTCYTGPYRRQTGDCSGTGVLPWTGNQVDRTDGGTSHRVRRK